MKKTRGLPPPRHCKIIRVVHIICAGKTYKEAGAVLGVSKETVGSWKRKYRSIWNSAMESWPIFHHKLAAIPLNAEKVIHAYCVEMKSLSQIEAEMGLRKARVIRFLKYVAIPRRKDAVQVAQNTANRLAIHKVASTYKNGTSLKDLSMQTGFSINTIKAHLEKAGVRIRGVSEAKRVSGKKRQRRRTGNQKRKQSQKTAERIALAKRWYTEEHNTSEIALGLGISRQAVDYYFAHPLWDIPRRAELYDIGRGFVPQLPCGER